MIRMSPMHDTTNPPGQSVSAIPAEVLYSHLTMEEPMDVQVPAKFGSAEVLRWYELAEFFGAVE